MKSRELGGRHAPFSEGYCPYFVVAGTTELLAVRAEHCPGGPVAPGTEGEASFSLLYSPNVDYSALVPGVFFEVIEGPRSVASGTVIRVVS